ncbi:MAG: ABC transporter permease [Fimbriimonas sp.]
MESPYHRWWAIAKMTIGLGIKKKGFWFWAALSSYWYILLIGVFYFLDTFGTGLTPDGKNPLLQMIVWKDQFVNAFSISQIFLFILAMLIGAGTIANDNRANALLVYLSKPCSKLDYLIGKWVGIFIPIFLISFVPTLLFYVYGALTYAQHGFLADSFILPKLVGMSAVAGFVHASLCLGVSSLFNQGRMAGATYAGLYFFGLFFTKAMQIAYVVQYERLKREPPAIISHLYYASIDGIQIGMSKVLLQTNGSPLFPNPARDATPTPIVPAPPAVPIILAMLAICTISLLVAWRRVRAVEVVG